MPSHSVRLVKAKGDIAVSDPTCQLRLSAVGLVKAKRSIAVRHLTFRLILSVQDMPIRVPMHSRCIPKDRGILVDRDIPKDRGLQAHPKDRPRDLQTNSKDRDNPRVMTTRTCTSMAKLYEDSSSMPGSTFDISVEREQSRSHREEWWVTHQPLLCSRGYRLRPRYHADWVPSWTLPGSTLAAFAAEDGFHGFKDDVLDAIRVSDGLKVVFKRVHTHKAELDLIRYLNSPDLLDNPYNRTSRLLDIIPIPDDDTFVLIVMPCLRLFWTPIFRHLREVIECMRQFLQGLVFMHECNIAHGDACRRNLMMDATRIVPGGSHFHASWAHPDNTTVHFRWRDRCSVAPVDYYFIDFGLSEYYPDGQDSAVVTGSYGQDSTVPEFQSDEPHNPFKVDVYQLGNALTRTLAPFSAHIQRLAPLLESMTMPDPTARPTAAEALKRFEIIAAGIPDTELGGVMKYEADSDSDAEEDLANEILSDDEPRES
ncbi:Protein kinase domain-containing protein [Mycena chlorophos]|uniref:Protein kinase domain-containing protein n=1 Tax=Mycena chlorophos TaxID=658473 RepID=A0A8H6T3I5_MYCCL|nr:Protein kinase domain-containing protein [Mycena chlorophos]